MALFRIIKQQGRLIDELRESLDWAHFVIQTATNHPDDWKARVILAMSPDRRGTYWLDLMAGMLKELGEA